MGEDGAEKAGERERERGEEAAMLNPGPSPLFLSPLLLSSSSPLS
jgi:hypothetical protein